jgi:hypothetical protein
MDVLADMELHCRADGALFGEALTGRGRSGSR